MHKTANKAAKIKPIHITLHMLVCLFGIKRNCL